MSSPVGALFVSQYLMKDKEGQMWRVRNRRSGTTTLPRAGEDRGRDPKDHAGLESRGRRLRLRPRHA